MPPSPAWYGVLVAVFFVIADPLRIVGLGIVGPLGVVLAFV
jgi:hypothetical protein